MIEYQLAVLRYYVSDTAYPTSAKAHEVRVLGGPVEDQPSFSSWISLANTLGQHGWEYVSNSGVNGTLEDGGNWAVVAIDVYFKRAVDYEGDSFQR